MTMYYSEARALMASARNPANGKPLQNNTRLYEREVRDPRHGGRRITVYAVCLHYTDVVTIYPDFWELAANGWITVTTQSRINGYAPGFVGSNYRGDGWMLPVQDAPAEPSRGQRRVPHPFNATDPGLEPIKSPNDCIAGTTLELPFEDTEYLFGFGRDELCAETAFDNVDGNWPDFTSWTDSVKYLRAHRAHIERVYYGEGAYGYHEHDKPPGHEYKQCPHCKAFDARHAHWSTGMHGSRWGRGYGKGWELHSEMMETYGSREAWLEAARDDLRAVKAANAEWKKWYYANHVPFFDGVRVDHSGRVLKKQAESYFKAQRAQLRDERRREREHEAYLQRQRLRERLRARYERRREQREPQFIRIANDVANELREIRELASRTAPLN